MVMPMIQGQETEYKPWGGLAGIMTGEREGLQHAANLQGLEEARLGNMIKEIEAARAQSDFNTPGMEQWRQAGVMGQGMQQDATGRLKQGTLGTDITAGNAKNRFDTSSNEMKQFFNEVDFVLSMPDGLASVGTQLSPQMQMLAQKVGGIDRLKQVLPMIRDQLKNFEMDTGKYRGDVALKGAEHTNTMERVRFEQGETTKRNNADNAAKSADRAAIKESTAETKAQGEANRREAELTRRMEHGRQKLKLLQDEYQQIDEAIATPVFGMTKEEKAARKTRLENRKKEIQQSAKTLVTEMDRLSSLSTFAPKAGEGTAAKPIKLD